MRQFEAKGAGVRTDRTSITELAGIEHTVSSRVLFNALRYKIFIRGRVNVTNRIAGCLLYTGTDSLSTPALQKNVWVCPILV